MAQKNILTEKQTYITRKEIWGTVGSQTASIETSKSTPFDAVLSFDVDLLRVEESFIYHFLDCEVVRFCRPYSNRYFYLFEKSS